MLRYWGKRNGVEVHLLQYHLIDSGSVCEELLKSDKALLRQLSEYTGISESDALCFFPFLTAIHDLGKYSFKFQALSEGIPIDYTRHDKMGASLFELLKGDMQSLFCDCGSRDLKGLRCLFMLTEMHHGSPAGCEDHRIITEMFTNEDITSVKNAFSLLKSLYGVDKLKLNYQGAMKEYLKRISNLLSGMISASDWISSDEHLFNYVSELMPLDQYQEYSRNEARDALESLGISLMKIESPGEFNRLFGYAPYPIQRVVSSLDYTDKCMIIIEDATGSGKTEASIFAALNLISNEVGGGIYFALPTGATSNMMFSRLMKYKGNIINDNVNISLIHSTSRNYLNSNGFSDDSVGAWTYGSNLKSMLSTIGVGTMDQALMAIMPVRYQTLRLYALTRHVLIIDEVHAYDAYTFRLLVELVHQCWAFQISVIAMSATLPARMKSELLFAYGAVDTSISASYPMITQCKNGIVSEYASECAPGSKRSVSVKLCHDESIIIRELIDCAMAGHRVCWIRNTVDDAIDAYRTIDNLDIEIILIHSRFTIGDRDRKEKRLIELCGKNAERTNGLIVISTQVIEQSLDIEFDRMYSDLSPIDSVFQRIGRLQRFKTCKIPPEIIVNCPEYSENPDDNWYKSYFLRAAYVYRDHYQLWRTAGCLNTNNLFFPDDYRRLIEYVYSEDLVENGLTQSHISHLKDELRESGLADINALRLDDCYSDISVLSWNEDTPTRVGEAKTPCILLVKGDDGITSMNENVEDSIVMLNGRKYGAPIVCDAGDFGIKQIVPLSMIHNRYLVMERDGDIFTGSIICRGRRITVEYSAKLGIVYGLEIRG